MHATESKYQLSIHWGEEVQSWNKVYEIVKACETKGEKRAFKLKALLLTTRFVTGTRLVARVTSLVRYDAFFLYTFCHSDTICRPGDKSCQM